MHIQSLGYKTNLIFNNYDGSVTENKRYITIKTRNNPNFFWGNLLLYKQPPKHGDLQLWKSDFKKEFTNPKIFHMTFAWDCPDGNLGDHSEFIADGFELDKSVVLTSQSVSKPPKFNSQVSIQPLKSDDDFEKIISTQTSCGNKEILSEKSWESFYRAQMLQYKKMINDGLGHWFGAYLNNELVGGLGLFFENNIGRFQQVCTAPSYQGQGACRSLVYLASQYAFQNMNVDTLVMVADQEYHAAKIYESVGFIPTQKQAGVCWWDKSKTN